MAQTKLRSYSVRGGDGKKLDWYNKEYNEIVEICPKTMI